MRYLIIILTLLLSFSCVTQKRCYRKYPPQTVIERHDSTIIRDSIVFHDRIIKDTIHADTVFKEREVIRLKKIQIPPLTVENTYSIASAWIENSKLKLQLTTKQQVIDRLLLNAERDATHWREKYITEKRTEIVEVKFTPKWIKTLAWIGAISILLILLFIAYKVFKPKFLR